MNITPSGVVVPKQESTSGTSMRPVVGGEFWVVESLPANVLIGLDSLTALAAYELNPDEFYSNFEQTGQSASINRILDVSGGKVCRAVAGVRQRIRRPIRAEGHAASDDIECKSAPLHLSCVKTATNTSSSKCDNHSSTYAHHRDPRSERERA